GTILVQGPNIAVTQALMNPTGTLTLSSNSNVTIGSITGTAAGSILSVVGGQSITHTGSILLPSGNVQMTSTLGTISASLIDVSGFGAAASTCNNCAGGSTGGAGGTIALASYLNLTSGALR